MGKTQKKAQLKRNIRLGDKVVTVSTNLFQGQHVEYTGFGYHETDKQRAENRRARRMEEKRVKMGDFD